MNVILTYIQINRNIHKQYINKFFLTFSVLRFFLLTSFPSFSKFLLPVLSQFFFAEFHFFVSWLNSFDWIYHSLTTWFSSTFSTSLVTKISITSVFSWTVILHIHTIREPHKFLIIKKYFKLCNWYFPPYGLSSHRTVSALLLISGLSFSVHCILTYKTKYSYKVIIIACVLDTLSLISYS